ncbi:hypothetical protein GCM10009680_69530 [Streptomyces yatensis]|uniref:Uncharacterized protein n=1 Tax=Streptomyces yatensis TaxID=155177 RepID=A0ABN2J5Q5_9ACTN
MLEPQRVHVGRVHVQPVAARDLCDGVGRAEGPAQPRDEGLQGVAGPGGKVLGPDRVDQDALLDRAPTGERQPYDQTPRPGTGDGQGRVTARHPKGAEQRDAKRTPVHPPIFAHAPSGPRIRAVPASGRRLDQAGAAPDGRVGAMCPRVNAMCAPCERPASVFPCLKTTGFGRGVLSCMT